MAGTLRINQQITLAMFRERRAAAVADRIFATVGCYSGTWSATFEREISDGARSLGMPPQDFRPLVLRYLVPRCPCGVGRRPSAGCF